MHRSGSDNRMSVRAHRWRHPPHTHIRRNRRAGQDGYDRSGRDSPNRSACSSCDVLLCASPPRPANRHSPTRIRPMTDVYKWDCQQSESLRVAVDASGIRRQYRSDRRTVPNSMCQARNVWRSRRMRRSPYLRQSRLANRLRRPRPPNTPQARGSEIRSP